MKEISLGKLLEWMTEEWNLANLSAGKDKSKKPLALENAVSEKSILTILIIAKWSIFSVILWNGWIV